MNKNLLIMNLLRNKNLKILLLVIVKKQEVAHRFEEMTKAYQDWQAEWMLNEIKNEPSYGYY